MLRKLKVSLRGNLPRDKVGTRHASIVYSHVITSCNGILPDMREKSWRTHKRDCDCHVVISPSCRSKEYRPYPYAKGNQLYHKRDYDQWRQRRLSQWNLTLLVGNASRDWFVAVSQTWKFLSRQFMYRSLSGAFGTNLFPSRTYLFGECAIAKQAVCEILVPRNCVRLLVGTQT